jgi:tetratricopeptide (TPR) repeat protein
MVDKNIDAQEFLHLAIESSNNKNSEDTLNYLKSALELSPDFAEARLLLGATYADLGMFDRAEEQIKTAIEYDNGLSVAHFQLGLLYITSNRVDEAMASWAALDNLDEENPYYLFKVGLLALANDNFEECLTYLERGVENNVENEPLNINIQNIIESVKTSQIATDSDSESNPAQPVNLSAYESAED